MVMGARKEIDKTLASQVTLNEVNDIIMNYKIDVSKHNFTKILLFRMQIKLKHISKLQVLHKKITESAATKEGISTNFQSNMNFMVPMLMY